MLEIEKVFFDKTEYELFNYKIDEWFENNRIMCQRSYIPRFKRSMDDKVQMEYAITFKFENKSDALFFKLKFF